MRPSQELIPREAFGIALPRSGKHAFNVALEHRVRRDEEHLAGIEALALLVEQIRDALHEHRRLPAAGDAVHQQGGRPRGG